MTAERPVSTSDKALRPVPRWYSRLRLGGAILLGVGCVAFIVMFPFIAGEPAHPGDDKDPSWFPLAGGVAFGLMITGSVLLIAPLVHRLVTRKNGGG